MDIGAFAKSVLLFFLTIPFFIRLAFTTVQTYTNLTVSQIRCNLDGNEFLSKCGGQYTHCVKRFSDGGTHCSGNTCQGFCVFETQGNGHCSDYPLPRQEYDQHRYDPPEKRYSEKDSPYLTIEQPCAIQ